MRSLRRRPPDPRPLSIYDLVHLGVDEDGQAATVRLIYRNLLIAGEPGAGKSGALNNVVAHAVLAGDCRLWLMDGKRVELGLWRTRAERFIGPDLGQAIDGLSELQSEMDRRYDVLDTGTRRKIEPADGTAPILLVIDELAYYSATAGDKKQRDQFSLLLRDVIARGRAAGIIVVAATQRPSADIIPTSLRDPVRLPPGVPVHHRDQLRHRARARLGRTRARRVADRPRHAGRRVAARRGRGAAPYPLLVAVRCRHLRDRRAGRVMGDYPTAMAGIVVVCGLAALCVVWPVLDVVLTAALLAGLVLLVGGYWAREAFRELRHRSELRQIDRREDVSAADRVSWLS